MKQKTTCNIYSKKVPIDFKKANGKKQTFHHLLKIREILLHVRWC